MHSSIFATGIWSKSLPRTPPPITREANERAAARVSSEKDQLPSPKYQLLYFFAFLPPVFLNSLSLLLKKLLVISKEVEFSYG